MRALIVRLSSIGDVVHTLPVLAALHRHGHEAGWLVEPAALPLLRGHPLLATVVEAPPARVFTLAPAGDAVRALRAARFDVAIDAQGLWKSAGWARLSGAARVLGFSPAYRREPSSALLLNERAEMDEAARHVIDKNLSLLVPLGLKAIGLREFPLPPLADEDERVQRELRGFRAERIALLNPGGGWASKLWPAESFGALASGLRELGLTPLVTWGPGEEAVADRVVAASGGAARRSFATTLREYVSLARRARLVIAADTGPLHIACAVGTPVVALFGPTDPERNGPFAPEDVVVRRAPGCAPCYRRACTVHARVMAEIPVADVLDAAARRMATAGEPRAV